MRLSRLGVLLNLLIGRLRPELYARLGIGLVGAFLSVFLFGMAVDDCFITFRVAHHLAHGQGLVYNAGEVHQATSAPGYAIILAAISALGGDIPVAASLLSSFALVMLGLGLFELLSECGVKPSSFLTPVSAMCLTSVNQGFSNEILPQAALIVWAMALGNKRKFWWSTAFLIGATLVRPDGLLAAVALGVAFVITAVAHRTSKENLLNQVLVYTAVVTVAVAMHAAYYGVPLPQTMAAKEAQVIGGIASSTPFFPGLWRYYDYGSLSMSPLRIQMLCTVGALLMLRPQRRWLALVLWIAAHGCLYGFRRIGFYEWYAVPSGIGIALVVGIAMDLLWAHRNEGWPLIAAFLGLALLQLWDWANTLYEIMLGGGMGLVPILGVCLVVLLAATLVFQAVRWGVRALLGWPPARFGGWLVACYWLLLCVGLVYQQTAESIRHAEQTKGSKHLELYHQVGRWVNKNVPDGASVGYIEIGVIGYQAPRVNIVDALGLGSPGMLANARTGRWYDSYVERQPDYLLIHPVLMGAFIRQENLAAWLRSRYFLVTRINGHRAWIQVWRKRQVVERPKAVGAPTRQLEPS